MVKVSYILSAVFLLLSIASILIRKPVRKLLFKQFYRDKHISRIENLLMELSTVVSYIAFLIFLNLSLKTLPVLKGYERAVNLIFFSLYVAVATLAILKILDIVLEKLSENAKRKVPVSEAPLMETYFSMISKILKVFIFIVAAIAVLDRVGFNVTSIITSLGVGSLAVGLAAQDTIKNFISGILLVTDRQFRIGDRVNLRDLGVEGFVYDIGLRTTRIITISGNNLIIVPNSKLTEGIIENMLYPEPKTKDFVEVGVAYGSDVEKVKSLMLQAIEGVDGVLKDPPPSVFFTQFGDSALIFKAIYFVKDKSIAFGIKSKIHERIDRLFRENGIDIPFPCRTNYFPEGIRVKLEK